MLQFIGLKHGRVCIAANGLTLYKGDLCGFYRLGERCRRNERERQTEDMMPSNWELLKQVFTVETIMTPWNEVVVVEESALPSPEDALEEARDHDYSLLPVVAAGRVAGIFVTRSGKVIPPTLDQFVTRDTPIPDLIDLFAPAPLRGFVVVYRQDPVGFVTTADINKLPTRVYLYNLIAELEIKLATVIHTHFEGDDRAILERLPQSKTIEDIEEVSPSMRNAGFYVGVIQQLYISDLANILRKTPDLYRAVGFESGHKVDDVLGGLVDLRNKAAHPVKPLLKSSRGVRDLADDIQGIHRTLALIDEYAGTQQDKKRSESRFR